MRSLYEISLLRKSSLCMYCMDGAPLENGEHDLFGVEKVPCNEQRPVDAFSLESVGIDLAPPQKLCETGKASVPERDVRLPITQKERTMTDDEFLEKMARYWIDLGGDAEGVAWTWRDLQKKVAEMESTTISYP